MRLRNLIKPSAAERMATQEAPCRQARAAKRAVHGDGAYRIFTAGGLKPASADTQRMNGGRHPALVEAEESEKNARHACGGSGAGFALKRCASARAWVRIRRTSASSFANSMVSTIRRG